ncbi:hypothetical protein V8C86DRAFT_2434225 [Haematococcus lacustris]
MSIEQRCRQPPPHHAANSRQVNSAVLAESPPVSVQPEEASTSESGADLTKELNKFTRTTAATFAPRPSTASKNPAVKGSVLYNVFEVQGWLSLIVGGLLSFNVLYPSDQPDIARLLGMWSIWMFTIPSLRAKECTAKEKDALNVLFVGMPLLNVALPFVWKSFPFIFVMDTLMLLGTYYWKGVWADVYGLSWAAPAGAAEADAASPAGKESEQ